MDLSNRQTINEANYKLASIVVAQFRRGHRSLFYKTSHREDSPFVCADFLKKKANIHHIPDGRKTSRGISTSKKAGILKVLCPLMPKSRNVFWERIPVNDEAADLIAEF
ncbi:U-box domain-containing protein 16 [Elysia marginata]|uniref:U-box domain-containing protein 16 n=1 Tax=Elysia marginata TaxID=1093978 RepID=A0AAV4HHZ2_9GAST|nr:U-box domain-containing protein 16 [Elysia marginata]